MASPDLKDNLKVVDVEPKSQSSLFAKLRAYFFTGLVITAPIAITVWATYWFVTFFDAWVKPFIPAAYNPNTYLPFEVPGYGLIIALVAITFVGAIAANLVGRTLIGMWEKAFNKTPIVRSIYKGSKQIFTTIFSKKEASFRSVCLVEWPRRDIWAIAFVSREVDGAEVGLEAGRSMYAIYISTTPNPTGGYVFFADKADVKILDMTVEDGLKFVISMGLVLPERPMPPAAELAAASLPPPRPILKRRSSPAARRSKAAGSQPPR
jgi:uncharacterized membrane protein